MQTLFELLSERRELRPQLRHFATELLDKLFECRDPVGGSSRRLSRALRRDWRREHQANQNKCQGVRGGRCLHHQSLFQKQ